MITADPAWRLLLRCGAGSADRRIPACKHRVHAMRVMQALEYPRHGSIQALLWLCYTDYILRLVACCSPPYCDKAIVNRFAPLARPRI